jgi:hypothetical protein
MGIAAYYRPTQPSTVSSAAEPFRSAEHNYSFLLPGPAWRRDADVAKRLGGLLGFAHKEPDAWVVLAVRSYPKYVPAPGELREEAMARLRRFPFANIQPEDKAEATLAGRPAGRFIFQGSVNDTIMSGDVLYLTHQGAAYWLYRWCPATAVELAAAGLADLGDRFALLDERPHWQPPRKTFAGEKLKYTLTAEGDRWEKAQYPAANYDPAADLALVGQERVGATDAARQALTLVVL